MSFKDTIPKPNQIKIIISFVIVAIIVTSIVIFKKDIYKISENVTDSERFHKEYNLVPVDNVYKYVSVSEASELLKNKKAVIFFGFKECVWCNRFALMIYQVAKENNVDALYYCDIYNDRKENTEEYNKLIKSLDKYLYSDNENNKRLYVPDVYVVKDSKIIGHNNDTAKVDGTDVEEYYRINENTLKEKLNILFSKIKKETCSDTDKSC